MANYDKDGCRNYMVELYPDTESYDCKAVLDIACNELFNKWCYITHNFDTKEDGTLKKEHIHLVGHTKSAKFLDQVAEKLGVPSQFIEYCKHWKGACRYLIHIDDPDKFQYDAATVVANFDYNVVLDLSGAMQGTMIFNEICNTRHTATSLMAWALNNGCYSQYVRSFQVWRSILNELYGGYP